MLPFEVTDKLFILQIKKVREQIIIGNNGQPFQTVMITGVDKGHGASTTAYNLAYEFCRSTSLKVLLVDGNGTESAGKNDIGKILQKPLTDSLFVVHASFNEGTNPLARIQEQLKEMRNQFSYILFDVPPVMQVPEVLGLVPHVDLVMVVIQASRVKWQVLDKLKKTLLEAQPREIGVILNRKKYYIPANLYRRV